MPDPVLPSSTRLDGRGRLELAGVFVGASGFFTASIAHPVGTIRNEAAPSSTSWWLAAALGLVVGAALAASTAWAWRRTGGRPLQHLGRQVWRTERLPQGLPLRVAVLRDLERRDRKVAEDRSRPWLFVALYAGIAALNLISGLWSPSSWTWLGLLGFFTVSAVQHTRDVRRLPQLHRLIDELRADPVGTATISTPTT